MNGLAIPVDNHDHTQGPRNARVTLVEYGDYECPYCGEAYPILKAVKNLMGDRLLFVFRNFPISELHPHALRAAEFAEAAATKGRFWEAHDTLFEYQQALQDRDLLDYARKIGLDTAPVERGFNGGFDEKIRRDFLGGVRSGVNGTPSLFINGQRYDGPRDVEALLNVLMRTGAEDVASQPA
ncbi:DsbA family protein [Bosea sp. RAF48]|uniref:DsbA family protein n=1 Tax=Bosea sp. RAF48 TaxID=3237480 RepID=UPI003F8EE6E4